MIEVALIGVLLLLLAVGAFTWTGFGVVLVRDREYFISVPVLTIGICLGVIFVALLSEVIK